MMYKVGIPAKDGSRGFLDVTIRAELLFVFGDIPAVAKAM
jgi:hypothetical protein